MGPPRKAEIGSQKNPDSVWKYQSAHVDHNPFSGGAGANALEKGEALKKQV
jgi:hypothetical protein